MDILQYSVFWILCDWKITFTCVTWPKLAVCRWIYINIQYVDSLSRKNYHNVCHMAKKMDFFNGYKSIFHSILLSHKNYRNMCHTDKTLCFVSAYKSIFWYQSGIVWMLTPCHGKTNVTCVTRPILAVCRWIYVSIQYVESLSRKNYRNMCHMA